MKTEAILFDLDGTLWEVLDRTYETTKETTTKYNLKEVTKETISKCMGMNKKECSKHYFPELDEEEAIKLMNENLQLNVQRILENGGNVYNGVEETLKILKESYKLGIVSNCGAGYIEVFLSTSNLGKYFDDFIAASKLQITKAEAIKVIMTRNNIKNAIYVGDTAKDQEAATGANIEFIYAKYGFGKDIQHKYEIEDIKDLPNFMKTIDK